MTNYNNIINKTNNYYPILMNKSIIKNNNLRNTKNKKVSINFTNKNIFNKEYKNNLLKFSNKKQISIFIKGLDIINKYLKKVISNWSGNNKLKKNLKTQNNKLKLKKLNSFFLNIKNLNTKNLLLKNYFLSKNIKKQKVSIFSFINNNLITNSRLVLPSTTINSNYLTIVKYLSNYKSLIEYNKIKNYESIYTIRNYIKNITKFNSNSAYSFTKNYNYNFNSSTNAKNKLTKNLYIFLESSFYSMYCLISKPIFIITSDKVIIHIFYYSFLYYKKIINKKFNKKILNFKNKSSIFKYKKNILKLKIISQLLARYFKKPVVFELVKLNSPYLNTNILVKLLGFIINKTKLRIIKTSFFSGTKIIKSNKFLNDNNSPNYAQLAGIKVRVAGRLLTQRVVPRKTVKIFNKGRLARGKVIYLETARFTNKNKRGAFSITIFTGHVK
jgi:hypothetical protein